MIEKHEREAISRRRALSLLGLTGALGFVAPPILLAAADAEAQAIPPAFAQVDKPIPGEENATQRRVPRRKRATPRRQPRRKHRPAPRPQLQQPPEPQPPPQTQPFTGYKPY
jgi:hypothetical protein